MEMYIIGFLTGCVIVLILEIRSLQNKVLKYQKMVKEMQEEAISTQKKMTASLKSVSRGLLKLIIWN